MDLLIKIANEIEVLIIALAVMIFLSYHLDQYWGIRRREIGLKERQYNCCPLCDCDYDDEEAHTTH